MAAYSNMPDGMEPGLENVAYYDPPNLTWPFGCYIATVEVDPQTGVWDVLQRRRGRRLRRPDQPDDRRGADHGRPHRGLRHGQHAVHHLRRPGQLHRLELHGLPAADRLGDPGLRAARGGHAVPAPPDRRQGRRRVRHRRRSGRVRQRGHGRDQGHRRPQHRHAAAARPGLRGADHSATTCPARRRSGRTTDERSDAVSTAGTSSSRPPSCRGAARSSRWRRWCGGRDRRPGSRVRGRSSPRPGRSTAGSAAPAPSRWWSARPSR